MRHPPGKAQVDFGHALARVGGDGCASSRFTRAPDLEEINEFLKESCRKRPITTVQLGSKQILRFSVRLP